MEYLTKKDTDFTADVLKGLSAENKFLPAKYFYDKKGDKLFQRIMKLPEYYLTRTEFDILEDYKEKILQPIIEAGQPVNLVELGAGDGMKTKILIAFLYKQQIDFQYIPIDISGSVLEELRNDLDQEFPGLKVKPIQNTYQKALQEKDWDSGALTLMLFLGANLGNFVRADALELLQLMSASLKSGEMALLGFDLKKDPEIILNAYHDGLGVTSDFNLNVLQRINRELGGEFELNTFTHWPVYNPVTGECRSYLVSQIEQDIYVAALDKTFHFKKAEAIHTEISKKYDLEELGKLASETDFNVTKHFMDKRQYFTDSLWQKK